MDNNTPGFDDEPPPEPRDGWLLVRIHVPELNVYKCLQFPSERLVWDVKQQVLASLPKELKESFNYGLFCPPSNGKAGKFLDEERRLGDYPFNGPVGYLELKYKRRVYKMLNLDERQLKALHTRANLRRFLECINGGHVEKIAKMCAKGLDPNFHCPESGDTPLTVATGAKKPNKLLIALVNGGALLDYRTKDGATALHKAVEKDSLEAVTTLLELGASPNYKDGRGITPLYISITRKCDPKITESLLHDHAALGIQDNQGWQEVHQACRHGLVQHLEHLLFYGADMDGRNASGNTPLHVCAVNNQEACARMLLFRGAQRGALNFANQTPYQVAVIAGNLELAEMIQNYKSDEVVPFRGPPRYNPKRRSGIGWLNANGSVGSGGGGSGGGSMMGTLTRNSCGHHGPPSPCPSDTHMPYSSASSSLSEGSSGHRSHEDDISIVTDKSLGDTSDIISDSSGVGTNSDSAACSIGHPSTTVVCMEPYASNSMGHIRLQPGDVIEVVGSTDCGLLEGYVRGSNQSGFFPAECVQEVNLRQKNITNVSTAAPNQSPYQQHSSAASSIHQGSPQLSIGGSSGIGGGGTLPRQIMSQQHHHQQSPSLSLHSNGSSQALNGAGISAGNHQGGVQQYSSATAPRMKKPSFNDPRTVVLHRAKRGFGFILRGAKASSPLMQLKPSDRFPALQYLDDVDPGGVADMAGLRPGDFLLAIGGEDVRAASHEKVVEMIRSAGALVSMTVISPQFPNQMQAAPQYLPNSSYHMSSGPSTPQTAHRQCATLPRKMSLGPPSSGGRQPAPMPPRRDPKTTLSVGRARAKSMVAGLENGGEKDDDDVPHTKSNSVESIVTPTPTHPGTPVQLRTASIKARPTSSRITAAELEELFQRQQGEATAEGCSNRYSTMMTTSRFQSGTDSGAATPPTTNGSPLKGPLVYSSVSEMKRKTKTKNGTLRGKPCPIPTVGGRDLKRFHSTPDLNTHQNGSSSSIWTAVGKGHHSQDDVATLHASMQRLNLPPPSHPPPPPPTVGQVVKVETRATTSEYESTVTLQQKLKKRAETEGISSATVDGLQSSFNPSANAKIYASPQELRNVMAWKMRQAQENRQNGTTQQLHQQQQQPNNQQQQQPVSNSALPPPPPPMQQESQPLQIQQEQQPKQQPSSQYAQPTTTTPTNTTTSMRSNLKTTSQQASQYTASAATQQNGGSNNNNHANNSANTALLAGPAPPIPEPDYSFSESDGEDENSILVARNTKLNEKIALIDVPETSGNSQTSAGSSGSSSGSTSISHSLSVDEIQRIRSNLKTSKSYPNGLLKQSDKQSPTNGNGPEMPNNNTASDGQKHSKKPTNDTLKSDNNNGEEIADDNSSSGVSSDQEIVAAAPTVSKPTDTIKKKPTVTIVEEPKTIPDPIDQEDTTDSSNSVIAAPVAATTLPAATTTQESANTTTTAPKATTVHSTVVTIGSTTTTTTQPVAAAAATQVTQHTQPQQPQTQPQQPPTQPQAQPQQQKQTQPQHQTQPQKLAQPQPQPQPQQQPQQQQKPHPHPTMSTSSVASTAAVFEAKATTTTVTVKQMVQQQHAPAIQQQQQQLQQQPQVAIAAATKVKTLLVQSQQVAPKAQPNMAGRIMHVHAQQQQSHQLPQQAQHMHPNQKLMAAQQHILLQQQQQQHQQHQLQQQQQQQLAHQHHLQQILKSKTALGPSTTAAIVARQQQQQQLHGNNEPTTESEQEQRSDDDGELSPSPPAKAFQRHNSLTRKQAAAIAMQRATRTSAVSLVQLPPPLEADSDNEMMSLSSISSSAHASNASSGGRASMEICAENIVLAPPPQFCDCNDMKHAQQQQQQHHHHQQQQQQHHHIQLQQQHHLLQQQQQQQQQHHHHLQQQQQQHHHHQQQQQQAMAMSMHTHIIHSSGNNSSSSSGRVRIVGAVPKTTHHRLH